MRLIHPMHSMAIFPTNMQTLKHDGNLDADDVSDDAKNDAALCSVGNLAWLNPGKDSFRETSNLSLKLLVLEGGIS